LENKKGKVDWKMLNLPIVNPLPNERIERNLQKLHLEGLLKKPWFVKINSVVHDFYRENQEVVEDSIRRNVKFYTPELVAEVYSMQNVGEEKWLKGDINWSLYFDGGKLDAKTGWKVEHCTDQELNELFAFLLPIFYPSKPHRITKGFATTVILAFNGDRKVNWAAIFSQNVQKLASALHPEKHTYLCPFVVHGYAHKGILNLEEESEYDLSSATWQFQLDVKTEDAVDTEESDKSDSVLPPSVQPKKPASSTGFKSRPKKKTTKHRATSGKGPAMLEE
jgi:hypothetical protein